MFGLSPILLDRILLPVPRLIALKFLGPVAVVFLSSSISYNSSVCLFFELLYRGTVFFNKLSESKLGEQISKEL